MSVVNAVNHLSSIRLPRSLHAFGVNILLIPLGIASSILIARSLGPGEKGKLDLIIATVMLLVMVLSFSLPSGVTFVVAQSKVHLRKLTGQLALLTILQGALAAGILIILRHYGYSSSFLPSQAGEWIIAGIAAYVSFEMIANHLRAILNGKQENTKVNNTELIGRVSQALLLFAVAATLYLRGGRLSFVTLFILSLTITIFIAFLLLRALRPYWDERGKEEPLKAIVSFAFPCYFANLTQFLNYRLDVFIVGIFAGSASVGRYTLAVSLGQLVWLLSNSVATVLLPKVASDAEKSVLHTARVTRLSLCASLLFAVFLAIFASFALPLFYGEAFRPSVGALLFLLPGIVAFSIVNILAAYILGSGRPQLNLLVSFISLVVTVSLDLILIPRFDIIGASIATTASYSTAAVLSIWLFVKKTNTPVRDILFLHSDDIKLLISLVPPLRGRLGLERAG